MLVRSQADSTVGGGRAALGVVLGTGLVLTLIAAPAESMGWRETAREEGIVVSERVVPGRVVPTFRGIGLVETDLATVLGVILDVDRYPEWLEDCTESRLLLRESPSTLYLYHRTNVQWPVSDRDVILRAEVDVVDPGRVVFVRFESRADMAPLVPGVVRVEALVGHYRLEALAPRRTSVEYRVDVEPAGSLPGWVQRQATRSLPLGTVLGLRRQSTRIVRDRPPLLTAEPQGVVSPSVAVGVAASEPSVPLPSADVVTGLAPETTADTTGR